MNNSLTAIHGIKVGHAESKSVLTGVTVALFDKPYVCAVDARGGWPGSYDTESIDIGKNFYKNDAIFLTGGDVLGLDAAKGVRRFLVENGRDSLFPGELPSVIGANIYDILDQQFWNVNYEKLGYLAALNASKKPVKEGSVGVGRGATVGKLLSMSFASKGGVGSYNITVLEKINIACLVVTNSIGNIYNLTENRILAGTHNPIKNNEFVDLMDIADAYFNNKNFDKRSPKRATTLGIVATDANLSHEETIRLATVAHDGFARAIRPVHMNRDGDTIFAVSTGEFEVSGDRSRLTDIINESSCRCLAEAIARSVIY